MQPSENNNKNRTRGTETLREREREREKERKRKKKAGRRDREDDNERIVSYESTKRGSNFRKDKPRVLYYTVHVISNDNAANGTTKEKEREREREGEKLARVIKEKSREKHTRIRV